MPGRWSRERCRDGPGHGYAGAITGPGQRPPAAAIARGSGLTGTSATRTVGVASTPRAVARAATYRGQSRYGAPETHMVNAEPSSPAAVPSSASLASVSPGPPSGGWVIDQADLSSGHQISKRRSGRQFKTPAERAHEVDERVDADRAVSDQYPVALPGRTGGQPARDAQIAHGCLRREPARRCSAVLHA
jgi:hypothetical protein